MVVSMSLVIVLAYFRVISPTFAYDQFTQLAFTATVFSTLLAAYLYASSLWSSRDGGRYLTPETQLAPHGTTGNVLYDFFIGRTLNPRIGALDLKYFCELRPGLIGWALINLSMAAKQYQQLGYITNSMILVNLFQGYYVYDALNSEVSRTRGGMQRAQASMLELEPAHGRCFDCSRCAFLFVSRSSSSSSSLRPRS
jgi:delta14-sterol reductase